MSDVKKYETAFKGIVLNKKLSTKPDANGNMITKPYWTVLSEGHPVSLNGKKLIAFPSKSKEGNIVIMGMDSDNKVAYTPKELSSVQL